MGYYADSSAYQLWHCQKIRIEAICALKGPSPGNGPRIGTSRRPNETLLSRYKAFSVDLSWGRRMKKEQCSALFAAAPLRESSWLPR